MSLFIKVWVGSEYNKKLVADCYAYNTSDLADVSNYKFTSVDVGAEHLDIPHRVTEGVVEGHNRKQSVWTLVEKIAKETMK